MISVPFSITGTIEAMTQNFTRPARKVDDSLRFGFLLKRIMRRGTKRDAPMANRGLIDVIASISYLESP
jgi:hypothetical protein